MRLIVIACSFALATVLAAQARQNPAAERRDLLNSLKTSCREFSAESQWEQLDGCHRAWFKAHEEAIWRLDIDPHPRPVPPPS